LAKHRFNAPVTRVAARVIDCTCLSHYGALMTEVIRKCVISRLSDRIGR
jgi:hypothetical protein